MKSLLIIGIILMILGAAALAYRGINYTKEEKVLDIGPLTATAETQKRLPIPTPVGWALLVGGGLAVAGAYLLPKK